MGKVNTEDKSKCEGCTSFQGRDYHCKMGLWIRTNDMRTCEDFGKTNQREILVGRNIWDKVKKFWKD